MSVFNLFQLDETFTFSESGEQLTSGLNLGETSHLEEARPDKSSDKLSFILVHHIIMLFLSSLGWWNNCDLKVLSVSSVNHTQVDEVVR